MADIPDTDKEYIAQVAAALEIAKMSVAGSTTFKDSHKEAERTKILTNEFIKAIKAIGGLTEIS